MNDRVVIAQTIRERTSCLASERGMTLEDLSEKTDISKSLLTEPDLSRLRLDHLVKLADALAVPVTFLLSC